jgi:hypothetical protein
VTHLDTEASILEAFRAPVRLLYRMLSNSETRDSTERKRKSAVWVKLVRSGMGTGRE